MITEDYVSFETAKLLKEKGFNGECEYFYVNGELVRAQGTPGGPYNWNAGETPFNECSAPTLQMAMKWLREVHNYHICICLDSYVEPYDNLYYILIRRRKDKYENISPCEQVYYDTYEEAAEAAIKYCLENRI